MNDKVIAVMNKPKDCENCVWGICKYSTPFSTYRKGYYCNLKKPEDITIEDFFYTDEVHLKNCPLVSAEEHDKEIRVKSIDKFANWCYDNGIDFSYMSTDKKSGKQFIDDVISRYTEEQMKEVGE